MKQNHYTEETAKQFSGLSQTNYMALQAQLDCACKPYEDCFTYERWAAQGFHVKKGERAKKVITYIPIKKNVEGELKVVATRPHCTNIFCRCQVERNDGAKMEKPQEEILEGDYNG